MQVSNGGRNAAADVVQPTRRRCFSRGEQRLYDVADVDEVARLAPVPEDLRLLPAAQPVQEDRDHAPLERRQLARAVDVRQAAGDVSGAIQPVPGGEVRFASDFRGRVRRKRLRFVVFARGPLALAVDRASARCEDDASFGSARRLKHPHRADHVDVRVESGTLDRRPDIGLRRAVEDDFRSHPGSDLLEGLVADVELVQRRGRGEVSPRPGGEVVDDVNLIATREQRIDEVRPNEPSSASDHRPHRRLS